jgi:mRNA interferase RelE/StbE
MFQIRTTRKAKRRLKEIKISYQTQIINAFEEISEDPFQGKPLQDELAGQYCFQVGVYRIVYKINSEDQIVTILTAGHRATIYE